MYHPFIVGEKIYLRGLEKNDLSGNMFQWVNDPEVTYFMMMRGERPNSMELMEEEYERYTRSKNDVVFGIVDKKTDTLIGRVGLYDIHRISHFGEFRIIIGEKEYWNKGYGTEATKLTVQYGFETLNLSKVWLHTNAENKGAIKAYENAGFVHEGVLRQEIYRNGRYYDAVRMSILRDEYFARKEGK